MEQKQTGNVTVCVYVNKIKILEVFSTKGKEEEEEYIGVWIESQKQILCHFYAKTSC